MEVQFGEKECLACCGSDKFAKEMAAAAQFSSYEEAVEIARDIWFNQVDVNGWLEAFGAHPQIGQSPSSNHKSPTSAQWSKGEQSTALATATDSTLQELYDWNARYRQKFGFVFLICASGRSTPEILDELKRRYSNRPIVELEIAAQEQMKITELRLKKLYSAAKAATTTVQCTTADAMAKAEEDRVSIIGAHLASASASPAPKVSQTSTRTRPPITTHVLDTARGCPAAGIEVQLEMWKTSQPGPVFGNSDGSWIFQGSSMTDKDGRSGQLMDVIDALKPGIYRISFNTAKYNPDESQSKNKERKMQAIKEKISDMKEMRRAKSDAREEEKAEKELAKARMEVAREVRLAKEAEAAMDYHVEEATKKAVHQEEKHTSHSSTDHQSGPIPPDPSNPYSSDSNNSTCK